jgi:hypothetical protein
MRIAVLFDSDHEKYDGFYGDPIRNTILSSKVIQESGRHVKVKVGDVVLYSHAKSHTHYAEMAELTYFSHPWQILNAKAIRATYMRKTVYCWTIQNFTDLLQLDPEAVRKPYFAFQSSMKTFFEEAFKEAHNE